MYSRLKLVAVFCAALLVLVGQPALAQEPDSLQIPGLVEGTGTHFEVTDSEYLNVVLDAADPVNVSLHSIPEVITILVSGAGGSPSTSLTLSGLPTLTTIYKYQDDLSNALEIETDAAGVLSFTQDLADTHLVTLQTTPSTIFLSSSGWSPSYVGTWNSPTQTGTLTQDVNQTIQVIGNGITLDGAGHRSTGSGGYGVYVNSRNNVTIKNLTIEGYSYGVYLYYAKDCVVSFNTIRTRSSSYGVYTYQAQTTQIQDNTISAQSGVAYTSIWMDRSSYCRVERNTMTGANYGPFFAHSSKQGTMRHNSITARSYPVICYSSSNSNYIYNNNFVSTFNQGPYNDLSGNTFNFSPPTGGNYWNTWTTPDNNGDGFVDNPFYFSNGADYYPYTTPGPWGAGSGGNNPPLLATIGDKTVNELNPLSFTVQASDPDAPPQTLTYTLVSSPSGAYINSSSGAFNWTPTESQGPGFYTITVEVRDNGSPSLRDTETFNVSVIEVNKPPYIATIGNKTVNEESQLSFQVSASDQDVPANNLSYGLIGFLTPGASIDQAGVFRWTPSESQGPGTYTIIVRVTDNGSPSLSDTESFTVTVNEVNRPPYIDPISSKTVDEGTALTFQVQGTDPDLPANTLYYSLAGSVPPGASISPGGVFNWTPHEGQGPAGYAINIKVGDGSGLSYTRTISVVVNEVNTPPVLASISPKTVNEEATLSFMAVAVDNDVPANPLRFALSGSVPAGVAIDAVSGTFTWTPTETQGPGSYGMQIKVSDNGNPNMTHTQSFTVTVLEVNRPPVLGGFPTQMSCDEESQLQFSAAGSDPDYPPNDLTYSLIGSVPQGAKIDAHSGMVTWTPTEAQAPAVHPLKIQVIDNGAPPMTHTRTVNVTVKEVNRAPVLAGIGPQTIAEGSELTFTASASDPDLPPNHLTYSLVGAPSGATIDANAGVFRWTPDEAQGPGNYTIDVKVSDDGTPTLTHTQSFTVSVTEVNEYPVLSAVIDRSGKEGNLMTFTATATDPDLPANDLTFSLIGAPAGASIDAGTGKFLWTPSESQGPGEYSIEVRVTDDGSPPLSRSKTFRATVTEVNVAPVLAAISDQTIDEELTLTVPASASDSDLPANDLTFSFVTAPPTATINAMTGAINWTPDEADGPGDFAIRIRVTDDGTPPLSDEEAFTVHVNEVNIPPALTVPGPITVNEGSPVAFMATATDPDIPANTLTFSLVTPSPAGASIDPATGSFSWLTDDNGDFIVRVSVDDGAGGVTRADVPVTVLNVNPVVTITGPPSGALYSVDVPVTFTGAFTDPGSADTHTAEWQFDTITVPGTVDPSAHTVTDTYTFTTAGVYLVRLAVIDDDGGEGLATQVDSLDAMVVVYDPEAGFVTGGGWIQSPPGAYVPDSTLTGKANFGFVSKYKKGASEPTGETEFQFKTASLNFHSTHYEWLMIAGARAQYKGSGAINGSGDFGFMLTAVDGGQLGNGGPDTFRMKITDRTTGALVYDNKLGAPDTDDPTTVLGGGSIVIHKPKPDGGNNPGTTQASKDALLAPAPTAWRLSQNSPNPFRSRTAIQFDAPQPVRVELVIFDAAGRIVRRLMNEERGSGRHEAVWNSITDEGLRVASGIYFASIAMTPVEGGEQYRAIRKMVVLR